MKKIILNKQNVIELSSKAMSFVKGGAIGVGVDIDTIDKAEGPARSDRRNGHCGYSDAHPVDVAHGCGGDGQVTRVGCMSC